MQCTAHTAYMNSVLVRLCILDVYVVINRSFSSKFPSFPHTSLTLMLPTQFNSLSRSCYRSPCHPAYSSWPSSTLFSPSSTFSSLPCISFAQFFCVIVSFCHLPSPFYLTLLHRLFMYYFSFHFSFCHPLSYWPAPTDLNLSSLSPSFTFLLPAICSLSPNFAFPL